MLGRGATTHRATDPRRLRSERKGKIASRAWSPVAQRQSGHARGEKTSLTYHSENRRSNPPAGKAEGMDPSGVEAAWSEAGAQQIVAARCLWCNRHSPADVLCLAGVCEYH